METTIELKYRAPFPIVNLVLPGPKGILGDTKADFHAAVKGQPSIWGCGPTQEAAVGSALITAQSILDDVKLPPVFKDATHSQIGEAALNGTLPSINVVRVD